MIACDTLSAKKIHPNQSKMSSNIRLVKICESCGLEFVAKTTVTQCCSDNCAKRLYKRKLRERKIEASLLNTRIKKGEKALITPMEVEIINGKQTLSLKEAAFLLD